MHIKWLGQGQKKRQYTVKLADTLNCFPWLFIFTVNADSFKWLQSKHVAALR
jgi:hypothetical protein